jgi:hypothetical protein
MSDKPVGRVTSAFIEARPARWWQQRYPLFLGWAPELLWLSLVVLSATVLFAVTEPFGLSHLEHSAARQFLLLLAVGALLLSLLTQVLLPSRLSERWEAHWTVGKALRYQLANLLLLATLIYLLALWHGYARLDARSAVQFLLITVLVGSVPVALTIVVKQNALMRATLRQLQQLATPAVVGVPLVEPLVLVSDLQETLLINEADIAYVRAQQNYCEVVGKDRRHLLRIRLKSLVGQLSDTSIIRCHRSYLVNLNRIRKIHGNAQGYQLRLFGSNETVPVSRSYLAEFNRRWQRHANARVQSN